MEQMKNGEKIALPAKLIICEKIFEPEGVRKLQMENPKEIHNFFITKIALQAAQIISKDQIIERLKAQMVGKAVIIKDVNFACQN